MPSMTFLVSYNDGISDGCTEEVVGTGQIVCYFSNTLVYSSKLYTKIYSCWSSLEESESLDSRLATCVSSSAGFAPTPIFTEITSAVFFPFEEFMS